MDRDQQDAAAAPDGAGGTGDLARIWDEIERLADRIDRAPRHERAAEAGDDPGPTA